MNTLCIVRKADTEEDTVCDSIDRKHLEQANPQTGSGLVVARDYRIRSDCLIGMMKVFWNYIVRCCTKLFKGTELYTLEWQILCYMNFSTLKKVSCWLPDDLAGG